MTQKTIAVDYGTFHVRLGYVNDQGEAQLIPNPESPGGARLFPIEQLQQNNSTKFISPSSISSLMPKELLAAETTFLESLKKIKEIAEGNLSSEVQRIAFAIPVELSEEHQAWLSEVGQKAGFSSVVCVHEDLAASIRYSKEEGTGKKIGVYDFGGGKFLFSLFDLEGAEPKRLAFCEDASLCGKKINEFIMEYFHDKDEEFGTGFEKHLNQDAQTKEGILKFVEKTKCALSHRHSVDFSTEEKESLKLPVPTLSSYELNGFVRDMIDETLKKSGEVLSSVGLEPSDLDDVVVVGGVTRMPAIQTALKVYFGRPPFSKLTPDQVVAQGVALTACV